MNKARRRLAEAVNGDQKFQEMLQDKVKQEMDDPYLKGDSVRQEAPTED